MRGPRDAFAAVLLATLTCVSAAPASAQSYGPGDTFRDCLACPEMVVVPPGSFKMGSSDSEASRVGGWRFTNETPLHDVRFVSPFAVGKYEVTFSEWDACVAAAGCLHKPDDLGWGRDDRPVMNVSWDDAQEYVAWLSSKTGQPYRLLTEAEWEYVARAGSRTHYWWGDDIGLGNANCWRCGGRWDSWPTAPVGSFAANRFGLYDVHGSVREWVEDCYHDSYSGAPSDGSAWTGEDCVSIVADSDDDAIVSPLVLRIMRGGGWGDVPEIARSAHRSGSGSRNRNAIFGFRVAMTLD